MRLTGQDRQFAIGVLVVVGAIILALAGTIEGYEALAALLAVAGFYGYGQAQLQREPPKPPRRNA